RSHSTLLSFPTRRSSDLFQPQLILQLRDLFCVRGPPVAELEALVTGFSDLFDLGRQRQVGEQRLDSHRQLETVRFCLRHTRDEWRLKQSSTSHRDCYIIVGN